MEGRYQWRVAVKLWHKTRLPRLPSEAKLGQMGKKEGKEAFVVWIVNQAQAKQVVLGPQGTSEGGLGCSVQLGERLGGKKSG